MNTRNLLPILIAAITTTVLLLPASSVANSPTIRLFPTTVLEDIRETGQVAEDMENNLQQIIHRLDMQQQLYTESLCQGADGEESGRGGLAFFHPHQQCSRGGGGLHGLPPARASGGSDSSRVNTVSSSVPVVMIVAPGRSVVNRLDGIAA